jgi:hypothetical protein
MSTRLTAADVTICACEEDHVAAITTIYAHHVLHGLASFEIEPPSEDDMRRRRLDIVGRNYPYSSPSVPERPSVTPTRRPTACVRLTAILPRTQSTYARHGPVVVSADS